MIATIKQIAAYWRLFYRHTRWRLLVLYLLIGSGGVIEAAGIVTLMPLLDIAVGGGGDNFISRAVVRVLAAVGITPTLNNLLLVIVSIFCARGVLVFLYTYFTAQITVGVRRNIQLELTQRFCEMSYPYYTERTSGWFNNIIVGEVSRFVSSLRTFSQISINAIHILIFLPVALSLKFELTLAIFALGGIVLWSLRGFIRRTAVLSREQTKNAGLLNSEFIQLIQAFIYLKATNGTAAVNRHVTRSIRNLTDNELRIKRTAALFSSIREPIAATALAAFIFYEVAVLGGSMAEIIVVALLIYRMLIQLVTLAPQLQTFTQTIGGVYAVQDVSRDLDRHHEATGTDQVSAAAATIAFHDVCFRHGDTEVLRDLNIIVRPNETVGIVGESGAGKTTFFYLLTGLLEPNDGRITIGGKAYSEIDRNALRKQIGYVTQDPVIFNDTVAHNISMWSDDGIDSECRERIRTAARAAKCDRFVTAMRDGYDTSLGERGIKLSGGERQRIAIARELFKDPGILIFDEAASALDAESESYVRESIDRMHGERTVVIITHRLASVRNCDRIYVFSSGHVIEEGTFDELHRAAGSYFRRMCDKQGVSA